MGANMVLCGFLFIRGETMEKEYYINIQWWMAQRLKLSGNELLTYAIVYGFSQDGESAFLGSSKFVSYALRVSRPTAIKALDSLTSKGLIIKTQEKINDIVFNRYKANLQVIKDFDRPYKESLQGGSKESLQGGYKETLHSNKYKELNNKEINKDIGGNNNTQNRQVETSEEMQEMQKELDQLKAENEKLKAKKEKPEKKKTLDIPTVEEVQAYCTERGNGIDAQHFVDYYSARGWMIGKNKIKDWKACVRTWERNDSFKPQKPVQQENVTTDKIDYSLPQDFLDLLKQ